MKTSDRFAVGLSVHTGWAVCAVAGGTLRAPRLASREKIEVLGDAARFLFHRAAEMKRANAERSVADARREAAERATAALRLVVEHARGAGHELVACAIVAKDGALLPLDEILAAHPRIHTAEGCFYRDVLRGAAEANGLAPRVISPKDLDAAAAAAMRVRPADLPALLAQAGRALGKPWDRDHQAASLAAWTVL